MDINEIRALHRAYFAEKGHCPIKSASVIPDVENGVLFTTAGMHPLVPYLSGEKESPYGSRITSTQKVIRTTDIEEVGDDVHMTFFEMLGNWSIGDYGKKETVEMSHEFITGDKYLGMPKENFWVTVFGGNDILPRDEKTADIWRKLGIPEDRIVFLKGDNNWWSMGDEGLCGPCTEMYIDTRPGEPVTDGNRLGDDPNNRFVEIGNNVFMNYARENGVLRQLPHNNVDVGYGLERIACLLQGYKSVYELPVYKQAEQVLLKNTKISTAAIDSDQALIRAKKVALDHARACIAIIGDEKKSTEPGNKGAEYIVRRLIRRMTYSADVLKISDNDLSATIKVFSDYYKEEYPEFEKKLPYVLEVVSKEQKKFRGSLSRGFNFLQKEISKVSGSEFPAEKAFSMLETYGFPVDLTVDIVREKGMTVDLKAVDACREQHRQQSRAKKNAP